LWLQIRTCIVCCIVLGVGNIAPRRCQLFMG
jgi:hypothetical protein